MKIKRLYTKLFAGSLLLFSGSMTSCDDFLTILPTDSLPEENFWKDKADLENVRAGAYDQLTQEGQTGKILTWGEFRADNLVQNDMSNTNMTFIMDATLQPTFNMFDWSGFYKGINYCNLILVKGLEMTEPGKEVDPSFNRQQYMPYQAEMIALRSLYYFYLVRAYRDVPYVTEPITTDKQALVARPAATPGVAILGDCIAQLEENLQYAAENYGEQSENKGRFTKNSIRALLADMYLWRGCMLRNYRNKHLSFEGADDRVSLSDEIGSPAPNDACNKIAADCFAKAIEYSKAAIARIRVDYDKELERNQNATIWQRTQPYPLYVNNILSSRYFEDNAYNRNFGSQNSLESILELQYDGVLTKNNAVNNNLSIYEGNEFKPKLMALNQSLIAGVTSVNPNQGFGRTDYRLWETCNYSSKEAKKPITKFVATNIDFTNCEDLTMQKTEDQANLSGRTASSQNAHWPVYRLADVMLIQAEATARLWQVDEEQLDATTKVEGFRLVNHLFRRNNPALVVAGATDPALNCDRISDNYASANADGVVNRSSSELLTLVYKERQLEFIAEGKRWFDLVRQAEYSNDTKATLTKFATMKASVQKKLSDLWSFYVPYYSKELKVNGVENGGSLHQNPVWERYNKK